MLRSKEEKELLIKTRKQLLAECVEMKEKTQDQINTIEASIKRIYNGLKRSDVVASEYRDYSSALNNFRAELSALEMKLAEAEHSIRWEEDALRGLENSEFLDGGIEYDYEDQDLE